MINHACNTVRAAVLAMAACAGMTATMAQEGAGRPVAAKPVPPMRFRLLTTLTGYEVSQYLKRNDVIFVPVGPTEVNGGSPTDVEYVIPLAYALKLAKMAKANSGRFN